jgi:hypothetical protein
VFPNVQGHDLLCHESLLESPFTFSVPYMALHAACESRMTIKAKLQQHLKQLKSAPIVVSKHHHQAPAGKSNSGTADLSFVTAHSTN